MNKDKQIRELYNSTFQEIHASDELKGMVEDMADQKNLIWKNAWKKCIAAAAALAVVFLAGNVVTYAAAGENLVKYVTVKIQGENVETLSQLRRRLDKCKVDQKIAVTAMRKGAEGYVEIVFDVTVGAL